MFYAAIQPEDAVAAWTKASNQPTKEQVIDIALMTHSGHVLLERVQEALFKRVVNPESYPPREIENTLTIIQQCLFIGSPAFVAFFKNRIYAVAALTNYPGLSVDTDRIVHVQRRAKILTRLLQDNERLQKERNKSVVPNVPIAVGGNAPSRGVRTWRDWRSSTSSVLPSSPTFWPSPESSPVRGASSLQQDPRGFDHSTVNPAGDVMTGSPKLSLDITHDDLNSIKEMTFESEQLRILIRFLGEKLLNRDDEAPLIEVLNIIKHCLLHGSDEFATRFRESQEAITALCSSRSLAVSSLAEEILRRMEDSRSRGESDGGQTRPASFVDTLSISNVSSNTESNTISLHDPVRDLTAFITTIGDHPIASGGYGFVYRATLSVGQSQEEVAKKILSSHLISPTRLAKRINREVRAWTRLSHPNIAELYGITRETNGSLGLISPFFENGNIEEYLKTSRVDVLQMMIEIAQGVEYLHDQDIIHGDIKSSNIMIDKAGHAKLIDFGLSRIMGERGTTTSGSGITIAFAAPELLLPDDESLVVKSKSSDVYATAITFVQVMSGRAPYPGLNTYGIISRVTAGCVPDRPSPEDECHYFPEDDLWVLLLCCWAQKPEDRPTISAVREGLTLMKNRA